MFMFILLIFPVQFNGHSSEKLECFVAGRNSVGGGWENVPFRIPITWSKNQCRDFKVHQWLRVFNSLSNYGDGNVNWAKADNSCKIRT